MKSSQILSEFHLKNFGESGMTWFSLSPLSCSSLSQHSLFHDDRLVVILIVVPLYVM